MTDLSAREWWLLAPIAVAVLWIGVYPETFMRPMRNDVGRLLTRLERVAPAVGRRRSNAFETREQPADVIAHRPDEAFGIDAHPQHRERDRREQPPFAGRSRSGIAAASALRCVPKQIRQ